MVVTTTKKFTMKAYGEVGSQKAPRHNSKEVTRGPYYNRTLSFTELKVNSPTMKLKFLFKKEEVPEGNLICSLHKDGDCIWPRKDLGPRFKATLLEKVCLEDDLRIPKGDFYPTLKRLMAERRNWGVEFTFKGISSFVPYLMEWTEYILGTYKGPLKQAGVYGLVGISQFPYSYTKDVWKAFCEHWGPLTNTFHYGGGELGISLNDLKVIGGLPILGEPYEEYLPPNELLLDDAHYPPTVAELLRVHADLCEHNNTSEVTWYQWIRHFFRGEMRFSAYGEDHPVSRKKKINPSNFEEKSKAPLSLYISSEGELAAYLALLLSRFVLPFGSRSVRPETFVMASLIAQGRRISLAPTVLGHIYHELGKVATFPGNPGSAKPNFGIHFIVGWLAEYFPCLYPCRPHDEFDDDFPTLARYAGVIGHEVSLYQARLIFRGIERASYRAVSFGLGVGGQDYIDSADLSDECFEHLLTIRTALLPVRFGTTMMLEPYYPNRFARQFGFDQGIPADSLSFPLSQRSKKSLETLTIASAQLMKKDTGVIFNIPHCYYLGTYTYSYCGWWARVSAPYLAQSCSQIKSVPTGTPCIEREPVFQITDTKIIREGMKGKVTIEEVEQSNFLQHSPEQHSFEHRSPEECESELRGSKQREPNQRKRRSRSAHSTRSSPSICGDSSVYVQEPTLSAADLTERRPPGDNRYFKQQRRGNRSESSSSMGRYDLLPRANFSIPQGDVLDEDNSTFNVTADNATVLAEVTANTVTVPAQATADMATTLVVADVTADSATALVVADVTADTTTTPEVAEVTADTTTTLVVAEVTADTTTTLVVAEVTADTTIDVAAVTADSATALVVADVTADTTTTPEVAEVTADTTTTLVVAEVTADTTIDVAAVTADTTTTLAFAAVSQVPSLGMDIEPSGMIPIPSISVSLHDMLALVPDDWIRDSLITGIRRIAKAFSDLQSPKELLAEKACILRFLGTVEAIAKTNKIDLVWFISKVQTLIDDVEAVANISNTVNVKHIQQLSVQLAASSSQLASKRNQLAHSLDQWFSNLREEEQALLLLKERVREAELRLESLKTEQVAQKAALQGSILEEEQEVLLIQVELDRSGQSQLVELQSKETNIQALANEIIAFSSSY